MVIIKWLAKGFGILLMAGLLVSCTTSTDLQWNEEVGYRWAEVSPGYFGSTGFTELDSNDTDIHFKNVASQSSIEENRNFLNGSGVATADLDNDGDADFVINRFNQEAVVYRNETNASRIAVRLSGESSNTEGIGAKVTVTGASVDQQKEMSAGGTYVSRSQPMLFFAASADNENQHYNR